MKIPKHWNDEPIAFEAIAEALEGSDSGEISDVYATEERSAYGERGEISLSIGGKRFALKLEEIV